MDLQKSSGGRVINLRLPSYHDKLFRGHAYEAAEMDQQLKTLVALTENLVSGTFTAAYNQLPVTSVPDIPTPLSGLHGHREYTQSTQMYASKHTLN